MTHIFAKEDGRKVSVSEDMARTIRFIATSKGFLSDGTTPRMAGVRLLREVYPLSSEEATAVYNYITGV